jgi:hypothetical protein
MLFKFNFSTDSGSSYNETKTTIFIAYHDEADTASLYNIILVLIWHNLLALFKE